MLVKRSLQLVKMLASTSGKTGKLLRHEISENVFTISYIREVLQYGENHTVLQQLGIEILTSLALDEDAKEKIGSTGRIFSGIIMHFLQAGITRKSGYSQSCVWISICNADIGE